MVWADVKCKFKIILPTVIFSFIILECVYFNLSILSPALSAIFLYSYTALITEVFIYNSFFAG